MTIPVRIEYGNHVTLGNMYAIPRTGDHIECAFPESGVPRLQLIVIGVYFQEGYAQSEPFRIVIMTGDDPKQIEHNREALPRYNQQG